MRKEEKWREKAAAGIDPARYFFQAALLSPSKEHFNLSFKKSPKGIEEFEKKAKECFKEEVKIVIEGWSASGKLLPLELSKKGFLIYELNPHLGKHIRILEKEEHSDRRDAKATAKAGLFFEERLSKITLSEKREALSQYVRARERIKKRMDKRYQPAALPSFRILLSFLPPFFKKTSKRKREGSFSRNSLP